MGALLTAMNDVMVFLLLLVGLIRKQVSVIEDDVLEAAQKLASAAGPVLGIVRSAIDAIAAVGAYKPLKNLSALDAGMGQIVEFVALLARRLGQASDVGLEEAAKDFIDVAAPALDLLRAALQDMVKLSWYVPIPDRPALDRNMQQIVEFIKALVQHLADATDTDFYAAGYNFMRELAAGIEAGMSLVQAALRALRELFPTSSANVAGMLAGVQGAGGAWVGAGASQPGGTTVVYFTYAPAVSMASQREAEEAIAPVLARVLERESRR
jgi:hypothetical protein